MNGSANPTFEQFESMRLALFEAQGFSGTSHRVTDATGNETYMIVGRGSGSRARILIHGGLSESAHWAMLAGRLTGRIVIPDRPGYGLSYGIDYREVEHFGEAAADWLLSVIEGIGEDRVDLVGTSMGGYFAIAFASRHPDKVRRLVLLAAPAGIERHIPWFLRMWANPLTGRLFMNSSMDSPEQLRERVYTGLVAHPERVPAEQLEVEFAAAQLPDYALTAHSMLRASIGLRGFRRRYLVGEDLAALEMPTLIAWGEQDTGFSPPSLGHEIASRMADGKFVLVPDAGHMPWIDQPDLVATAVNQFLDGANREERGPSGKAGNKGRNLGGE